MSTKKELKRMRQNQIIIIVLLFCAVIGILLIPSASANTITMANPGGIAERDIIVYHPNGTMYGYYNSTSIITLIDGDSYIFTMKPLQTNPLEDPGDWLTNNAFPFAQTYFIPIIVIIVCLSILISRRR